MDFGQDEDSCWLWHLEAKPQQANVQRAYGETCSQGHPLELTGEQARPTRRRCRVCRSDYDRSR